MSILDIYGKRKNGRKEPLIMPTDDAPPRFLSTPQQAVARPSSRSERAALAAAQWEEIENELRDSKAKYEMEVNSLKTEIQELKGRLITFESANSILNADCELLRVQVAENRSRLDTQRGKLQVAAKIILDMAEEERKSSLTEEQSIEAHNAVEEALTR